MLASALTFNSIVLLFIPWMGDDDVVWTNGVACIGIANLTAAFYLWVGIIEMRVLDRQWSDHIAEPL